MSLLPICGKTPERLMFNEMFFFVVVENRLNSVNFFKTGDSSENQQLSIIHEIYSSFDEGLEVRSVFLDILKGFDKVLHDGIIFKLTQNGISGNLLNEKMSMLEYLKVSHTWSVIVFDLH